MMEKLYKRVSPYKHVLPLIIYGFIYLSWFGYLEKTVTRSYHVIHMNIDDYIPFCEIFVIPYFLWFIYVSAVVFYFMLTSKEDYYKTCFFLFTGMTVFLLISTLWPNGHHLRPLFMPRDNIFTHMVSALYRTDTPTNLWPSIHVYNSLGAHFAIIGSSRLKKNKLLVGASFVLCVSIILSTMLIKQHSVFDVLTAFFMAALMYALVYHYDSIAVLSRSGKKTSPQTG